MKENSFIFCAWGRNTSVSRHHFSTMPPPPPHCSSLWCTRPFRIAPFTVAGSPSSISAAMLDPSGVLECVHAWAASAVQCHPYSSALPPVVDAWGQWLQMRITDACGTESVPVNCGVVAFLDGFDATTKGTYNTALQRLAARASRQYDTPFCGQLHVLLCQTA